MPQRFSPIPEEVADHLYVDLTSPSLLRWKHDRKNHVKKDQVAGTQRPDGRWRVSIGGKLFYTYRIYMFLSSGKQLDDLIVDHADGDSSIHKPSNLRLATRSQNNANRKPRGKFKGVSLHAKSGLWRCRIVVDGKEVTTYHATDELAARAYDEIASRVFGSFARLNFPGASDVCPA
jgi:hypothetical protein